MAMPHKFALSDSDAQPSATTVLAIALFVFSLLAWSVLGGIAVLG